METTQIGAWVDRRGIGGDWHRWLDVAVDIGLTDVSLCVHGKDEGQPFTPLVSPEKIGLICRAYADVGIQPHAMFWPQPRTSHATALLAYLHRVHHCAGGTLGSGELDAEEQYTESPVRLWHGKRISKMIRAGWPVGLPLVVNGITAALPKIKPLTDIADIVIPQAYTSTRKGQTSEPGARQGVVLDAWAAAAPHADMVCGLAAYSQEGAGGLSAADALSAAFFAAAKRVTKFRYWSLSELIDGPDAEFVRARCAELKRR